MYYEIRLKVAHKEIDRWESLMTPTLELPSELCFSLTADKLKFLA
jgi:hypothetical protein